MRAARPIGLLCVIALAVACDGLTRPQPLPSDSVAQPGAAPVQPRVGSGLPPVVLYTDLVAGPNIGGENDKGAYLSIFGKNFGTGGLGGDVRVYLGTTEVDNYRYLGRSMGRPDIDQITVQIGSLGNAAAGALLPVKVVADGLTSNTDVAFMVNPGRLLYVDNVKGNDATARIGDISRPFRHVQTSDLAAGAWGAARPGDIIVMRGRGVPWTDLGFENYFVRYANKSGSAPTGQPESGAIVLMGYPREDVFVRGTRAAGMSGGCISAINGLTYPGKGRWAVIADLRLDCEGIDGPISEEIRGDHWRVINNDLAASTAPTSGPHAPRMAGITGNGGDSVWLGNHIHDVQGRFGEAHGIYIDGQGSYEIAYNVIEQIRSGNGFQTYANGGNGSSEIDRVSFHHNLIHDVSKHGINIADGSRAGFLIYDNVVYRAAYAGIRFNTLDLSGARVYNNTFYDTNTRGNPLYGVLTNDWTLSPTALLFVNNILCPHPGERYLGGTEGLTPFPGTASHNVVYGGSGEALEIQPVTGDPRFVDPAGGNYHLASTSPAIGTGDTTVTSIVRTDFDLKPRTSASIDIGAYEH